MTKSLPDAPAAKPAIRSWVEHLYGRDLAGFVQRNAHPGAPHVVDPIAPQPIIVGDRASATYGIHPYPSKKPHELVLACIDAFTRPGDLVLDPFSGTGGIPVLAARMGRPAIAIDRSPAAAFIADLSHAVTDGVDVREQMRRAIIAARIQPLYATTCDRCGGPAETQFAVWRDVTRCQACGVGAGAVRGLEACPVCGTAWRGRVDRIAEELTEVELICERRCKPARARRPPDSVDVAKAMRTRPNLRLVPTRAFSQGLKTAELFARGIRRVDQLYTPRNLTALGQVRAALGDMQATESSGARLAWHASLLATSLKAQHLKGGGGYLPGMFYVPPLRKERNVAVTLRHVAARVQRGRIGLPAQPGVPPAPMVAAIGDARDLSAVPSGAIDYVFLDPPYHAKVQYSELNFLWEAWLGADDDWHEDDLVVNTVRRQSLTRWYDGIARVLGECARVMKPGAWMTCTFVPGRGVSSDELWSLMSAAGFERLASFDGVATNVQRTFVQRTSAASVEDQAIHFRRVR